MIHAFRAQNYGCLIDVEASLTPLHAFIGPNDSGKSTLLQGMRTVVERTPGFSTRSDDRLEPNTILTCGVNSGSKSVKPGSVKYVGDNEQIPLELRRARLVRLDPDALREPSGLIPETQRVDFLDDRGHGLAGIYFAIRNRDDDTFASIVADVRRLFPTIKTIRVKAVTSSEVVLEAELVSGGRVEAKGLSEGLLYYLAFAALRHLDPVSLLLVEEPENGLHPARIAQVVGVLRAISESGTQVVMATHSPLVVNELKPDEVSIVTRTATEGTRVKRIKDTPDFEERSKIYALGELWIAYANGEDEAPLLEGREP